MKYSPTLEINELSKKLKSQGVEIFSFGFGQSPFPVPAQIQSALKKNSFQKDYLPVLGLPQLRNAVATYYKNFEVVTEQIMIGPGSKELIFLCQFILKRELLLPQPSWVSYAPQANYINKKVTWINTKEENAYKITASALDETCQKISEKKLLILNSPNNPTGKSYDKQELIEIADVAKKHQLIVISDEIYERLTFNGSHYSLYEFYPEGTIISSGLSKWCGAGGWRLGTFLFPNELIPLQQEMAALASEVFSCVSAPIQYAACEAFENDELNQQYLSHSNIILKQISDLVIQSFQQTEITCHRPNGGFYVYPSFQNYKEKLSAIGITTSKELCKFLLEKLGIATLPGSAFGHDKQHLNLRLAYVDFNGSEILNLLNNCETNDEKIKVINKNIPQIKNGMNKLQSWLTTL